MQTGKLLLLTFSVFFFSFFSSCDSYCFGFSFQSHAFDEIQKQEAKTGVQTGVKECLVSITNMRKMFFAYFHVVKKSV